MVACPTCGKELTFIPQYDRWYCYAEGTYAPKGFAEGTSPAIPIGASATESHEGHHHCPSCGKELAFLQQYERWYCFAEGKYAPKDVEPVGAGSPGAASAEFPSSIDEPSPEVPSAAEATPVEPSVAEPVKEEEARPPEATSAGDLPVELSPPVAAEPAPFETPPEPATPMPEPVLEEPAPAEPAPERMEAPAAGPTLTVREAEIPAAASREPPASTRGRPKLSVFQIQKAKKAKLAQWCEAYGLETSGTRIELRDRLLQFLDEQDRDEEEAAPEAAPPIGTPPAEPMAEPTPEPEPVPEPLPVAEPESAPDPEPSLPQEPEPSGPAIEPEPAPEPAPPETVEDPEPAPVSELPAAESMESAFLEPSRVVEPPRAEPPPVAAPPSPVVVEVAKALPCPNCGKDLTYIATYDRLYCFSCGRYAPKTYGKPGAAMEAPRPVEPPRREPRVEPVVIAPPRIEPPKPEPKPAYPCPTCGRELRYVKDYDRWWCASEAKYAPKEYGRRPRYACPTCGQELTWINEYQRWYCYAEGKYGPRTIPAPGAATVVIARPSVVGAPATAPVVRVEAASLAAMEQRLAALESAQHAHGRPGAGIGLAVVGFSLVLVWFLFHPLLGPLQVLGLFDPLTLGLQVLQVLSVLAWIGFVLALAGVAAGLAGVRRR